MSSRHSAAAGARWLPARRATRVDEPRVAELAGREVHAHVQLGCVGDARRASSASWRHASSSTQPPISTMRPVSSAMGMNFAGGTVPSVGCAQRTSASTPERWPVGQRRRSAGSAPRARRVRSAPRRSCSSSSRSAARPASTASNTAMPSRPASLAWYIAVSASRIIVSKSTSGRCRRRRRPRGWPTSRSRRPRTEKGISKQRRIRSADSIAWSTSTTSARTITNSSPPVRATRSSVAHRRLEALRRRRPAARHRASGRPCRSRA